MSSDSSQGDDSDVRQGCYWGAEERVEYLRPQVSVRSTATSGWPVCGLRCVYQLIVRGTRINLAMKHQLCTAGGYAELVSTTLYSSTWHCRWPFPSTLLVQHLPHISRHPARTKRPLDFRGESTFLGKTCTFTHLEEQPIIHWQHQRRAGCSPFLLSYFLLFGFANETLKQYHSINATRPLDRLASHLNSLIYGRFFVPFLLNKL